MNFRGTFDVDHLEAFETRSLMLIRSVLLCCAGPEQYYERAQTPCIVSAAHTRTF